MRNWTERQRNILDFTLSSLWRRKGKTLALISVYTMVVFILASTIFFAHAIKREASIVLRHAPEIVVQRMSGARQEPIPLSYAARIREIGGVISVQPRLWGYYYDPVTGANYTMLVPGDSAPEPGNISIGAGVAAGRLADEGDTMEFLTHTGSVMEMNIRHRFPAETALLSADLILISEKDFRALFNPPVQFATDLVIRVRDPALREAIASQIARRLPDTRQITQEDILSAYDGLFNWRSGMMLVVLAGAILAFFIFAWEKASGLSLEERREIGIFKAIGWETTDVIAMKVWEGAVVSLSSFFTGVLLAYGHVFLLSSVLFNPVLKGWSVIDPKFKLLPAIDLLQLALLFLLAVLPYMVATIIPSWREAAVEPDAAMRI